MNDKRATSNQGTEEIKLIYELRLAGTIEELLGRLQLYKNAKDRLVSDYKVGCEIDISYSFMIAVSIRSQEKKSLEEAVKEYIKLTGNPVGYSSSNTMLNTANDDKGK